MKVILENFRCYSKKNFEIPDKGLVLLSGESGKGKTTFIQSIIYALFGKCSVKPYSHGTKNCTVTLEYKDIKINRQHKGTPYKLKVYYEDQEYTDDTAQTVINKYFGLNYDEFMVTSYVPQRSKSSVISMTPVDQLHFIEKLAFTDEVRKDFQLRFKNKLKETQDLISYTEGKISSLEEHYQKEKERTPELKDISSVNDLPPVDELRKKEKKLKSLISENEKNLKKTQEDIQNLKKEEERKATILEQKKQFDFELEQYNLKKKEIGEILSEDDIDEKNKEIIKLTGNIENMKLYTSYNQCLERANKHKTEYIENINSEIKKIKLLSDDDIEKINTNIEKMLNDEKLYNEEKIKVQEDSFFRNHSNDIFKNVVLEIKKEFSTLKSDKTHIITMFLNKKLTSLNKDIEKCKVDVDDLSKKELQGDVYKCPKCKSSLFFGEGELHISSVKNKDDIVKDYKSLIDEKRKEIDEMIFLSSKVNGWLNTIKDISNLLSKEKPKITVDFNPETLCNFREQIANNKQQKDKLSDFQNELSILEGNEINKYPSTLKGLFLEVEEKKKFLPRKFKPLSNIDVLQKQCEELKIFIIDEKRKRSEVLSLNKEISLRESKLKLINGSLSKNFLKTGSENRLEDLEESFNKLRKDSLEYSGELSSIQNLLSASLDFENYKKGIERLEDISNNLEKSKEDLRIYQRTLEGTLGLVASDKEAQILSLKTTISKINLYSKWYLDRIFEEDKDKISVKLQSHKLSNKGELKPKINTKIVYKGNYYDSYDDFCGGESQKCELAFLFGVNDMLGSKIVLLDECVNNLDAENNMKILYTLKKITEHGDKLTIAISHEAVKGVFESVINF